MSLWLDLSANDGSKIQVTTPQESLSQHSPQQVVWWRAVSICLSFLAFCIGGAAFLGWVLDNPYLKRIHPSLVTMKANTAVCLMLVAAALFLIQDPPTSTAKRRVSQVFAVIVALVGLITLSEHVLGWNSGLDQLLFFESKDRSGPLVSRSHGRRGVAQLLTTRPSAFVARCAFRRWFRVSNISVLLVIAITLLVFLYYFYGIDQNRSHRNLFHYRLTHRRCFPCSLCCDSTGAARTRRDRYVSWQQSGRGSGRSACGLLC